MRYRSPRALYAAVALGILGVELTIASGIIAGPFVRGSVGDILAVALIYSSLRAAACSPRSAVAIAVTVGFAIEGLQLLHVAERLGLKPGDSLYVLIGNTFSVLDLVMYVIGGAVAFAVDRAVIVPRLRQIHSVPDYENAPTR